MFIDFGERGGGWRKRREGERETERETLMWEGNIDWLPPFCAPPGDQTRQTTPKSGKRKVKTLGQGLG